MNPHDYINSFIKFGTKGGYKPGLKRINTLLEAFEHPENELNIIHVAGSNGKGSTISFLKSIYQEAGYRVGVYTSPHLIDFNERIEINGKRITTDELEEIIEVLKPVVDKIKETELGEPSFFEIVTTIAFLYFYQQKVDILLLEVGLGGRLDATNVIRSPLISVITSISLEHTSILGDTVEEIAREKAGIIKRNIPVVTGVRDKKALGEIEVIARDKESELIKVFDLYDYQLKESSLEGQVFRIIQTGQKPIKSVFNNDEDKKYTLKNYKETQLEEFRISLLGEYQIRNAVLAITVVQYLLDKFRLKKSTLKKGLKNAFIAGRMEVLKKEPLLIVDGAHNPDGIAKFVSYVKELINLKDYGRGRVYIILALLGDKDLKKMIEELIALGDIDLIVSENESERALEADVIKRELDNSAIENYVITPLSEAVKKVLKNTKKNDIICIVGSLYNIAEVKKVT